jgi:hypothetical protein
MAFRWFDEQLPSVVLRSRKFHAPSPQLNRRRGNRQSDREQSQLLFLFTRLGFVQRTDGSSSVEGYCRLVGIMIFVGRIVSLSAEEILTFEILAAWNYLTM